MTTTHDQTMNAIGGAILTAVANEPNLNVSSTWVGAQFEGGAPDGWVISVDPRPAMAFAAVIVYARGANWVFSSQGSPEAIAADVREIITGGES